MDRPASIRVAPRQTGSLRLWFMGVPSGNGSMGSSWRCSAWGRGACAGAAAASVDGEPTCRAPVILRFEVWFMVGSLESFVRSVAAGWFGCDVEQSTGRFLQLFEKKVRKLLWTPS